ncbi:MAG TPA: sugar transferase [Pirellulaceae bacterium]|nr:sugar transferase [Pirellulaceae bacterium]
MCRSLWATSDMRIPELPVLSAAQFERVLAKEVSRCQRRPSWLEFGVIKLQFDWTKHVAASQKLVRQMQERLRITDEIGWWNGTLAVVLPETDREGTLHVANWIEESGRDLGLVINTDVWMYPWDDSIGNKSRELWETSSDPAAPNSKARALSIGDLVRRSKDKTGASHLNPKATQMPFWKRAIDLIGSGMGLVLLAPFLGVVIWAIRRDSKGDAIFVQWREGLGGRPFRMYKFRTMRQDAEQMQDDLRFINEQDGPAFKLTDDPRVTRMGRWLRKTGLDELPQLWNVWRGEMSLVGPRPLPVQESECCAMWQRERLSVVPGITGIWQVSGGRNVTFDQWMRMDLAYVKHRSLWLDLRLLWATFWKSIYRRASV